MRRLTTTAMLMAIALLVTAGAALAQSTLEEAQKSGSITVGFAGEVPYAYLDEDGNLTGEAPEIHRRILARLGIDEMNGVLTEFGSLIPGLQAGRFDMISAGMYVTPERCEQVAFANPEYKIGAGLAVRAGNPHDLHSYEDIAADSSIRVSVMSGGAEYQQMLDVGVDEDQFVIVNDQASAVQAVVAGRADATTMTGPALQAVLDQVNNPAVERVDDFVQPIIDGQSVAGFGAAAFRHEDDILVARFNMELEKMKASGELLEVIQAFGFGVGELPGDTTAAQLCRG